MLFFAVGVALRSVHGGWGLGYGFNPACGVTARTLAANLVGGYLVGLASLFLFITQLSPEWRYSSSRFSGGSHFSTFSAKRSRCLLRDNMHGYGHHRSASGDHC